MVEIDDRREIGGRMTLRTARVGGRARMRESNGIRSDRSTAGPTRQRYERGSCGSSKPVGGRRRAGARPGVARAAVLGSGRGREGAVIEGRERGAGFDVHVAAAAAPRRPVHHQRARGPEIHVETGLRPFGTLHTHRGRNACLPVTEVAIASRDVDVRVRDLIMGACRDAGRNVGSCRGHGGRVGEAHGQVVVGARHGAAAVGETMALPAAVRARHRSVEGG